MHRLCLGNAGQRREAAVILWGVSGAHDAAIQPHARHLAASAPLS